MATLTRFVAAHSSIEQQYSNEHWAAWSDIEVY